MELPLPCLMLITDRQRRRPLPLLQAVDAAVAAGVDAVQLREKDLSARELYALAVELRRMTAGRCLLIVNSRMDVALAARADGVHLPEDGLPVRAVAALAPPGFLVGRSVHSVKDASAAANAGASYVQLGTIFETESKPGQAPAGLDLVRHATASLSVPCIAVGGIDAGNAAEVIAAGAQGVAVVGAILQAAVVGAAVAGLRAAIGAPAHGGRVGAETP